MTAPWVLDLSTHVVNPSYILFGSTLFFVGLMETTRPLRREALPLPVASFLMGFALVWMMQVHLCWLVLAPYVLLAAVFNAAEDPRTRFICLLFFIIGATGPAMLILPTIIKYGGGYGMGGIQQSFHINPNNSASPDVHVG